MSTMTNEELRSVVESLKKELDALKAKKLVSADAKKEDSGMKKNQTASRPSASRKYVLLDKSLASWGKVPPQQADLAAILAAHMQLNVPYTEAQVFEIITTEAAKYSHLAASKQDPTYLFRYYRGLKNDQKHAGFVARDFLRVIE